MNKPLVCVPLTGGSIEEVKSGVDAIIEKSKEYHIDVVEIRYDVIEKNIVEELSKNENTAVISYDAILRNVMKEAARLKESMKLLFTYRTVEEGGFGNRDAYMECNTAVMDLEESSIDMIDIEYTIEDFIKNILIAIAKEANIEVVCSKHNFEKTPSEEEMVETYEGMKGCIAKYAVMPNSEDDVQVLKNAHAKSVAAGTSTIGISMGALGSVTRTMTGLDNNFMTYICLDEATATAPGQITLEEYYKA